MSYSKESGLLYLPNSDEPIPYLYSVSRGQVRSYKEAPLPFCQSGVRRDLVGSLSSHFGPAGMSHVYPPPIWRLTGEHGLQPLSGELLFSPVQCHRRFTKSGDLNEIQSLILYLKCPSFIWKLFIICSTTRKISTWIRNLNKKNN